MLQNQIDEQPFFEAIKEHRGSYFALYKPPIPPAAFATGFVVFLESTEPVEARDILKRELHYWLKRYPVPLMLSAVDANDDPIPINNEEGWLVGWRNPTSGKYESSDKLNDLTSFLQTHRRLASWRSIYADLPFRTHEQIKAGAADYARTRREQKRIVTTLLTFWLVIIPAAVAVFEYFEPAWLGLVVLAYSLWRAAREWLRLTGRMKPSQLERQKSESERTARHYRYHCERNPEGFLRLKLENLRQDAKDRILRDSSEIAALSNADTKMKGSR